MNYRTKTMNEIERTKHDGAVSALKMRISALQHKFGTAWDDTTRNGTYRRLGDAITNAESTLRAMRETLSALQELEPDNR